MNRHSLASTNRGAILRVLQHSEPVARALIADRTGLHLSTVSRGIAQLEAAGLVCQQEAAENTGGRPRSLVSLNQESLATLAIDVADHHTETACVGLCGQVSERRRHEIPRGGPSDRLAHTIRTIKEEVGRAAGSGRQLLAVGVSIPGPVQPDGTIDFAPSLNWHGVRLGPILREELGLPVAVHNDANLIAIAESTYGAVRNPRALVAVAVFDGIGSGLVFNGTLWDGTRGSSGQIGRMLLTAGALENIYVGYGNLESHLGTLGIRKRAAAAGIPLTPEGEAFQELFLAQAPRSEAARQLAHEVLDEFALALVNVCALLDPEVIVLAGRFSPLASFLIPELRRRLEGRVLHVPLLQAESTHAPGTLLGAGLAAEVAFGPLEQLL